MRIHALACLLVLSLLAPIVAAGSKDHPEVSDPAGDPTGPPELDGDIRAVWIHDETATSFRVTMELERLADPPLNRFEVRFNHESDYSRGIWTLFAYLSTGTMKYELLGTSSSQETITGELRPGSPGTVTWIVPTTTIKASPGSILDRFVAETNVDVAVFNSMDDAKSDAAYQIGLEAYVSPFVAPTGPPLFWLGNMTTKAAHDLRGLWVVNGTDTVDFIVSTATLDPVDFPNCDLSLDVEVDHPDYELGDVSLEVEVKFGLNRTGGVETVDLNASLMRPPPGRQGGMYRSTYFPMNINLAAPGYFRVQVPSQYWPMTYDPLDLSISAFGVGENCGSNMYADSFYYPEYTDDYIPGLGTSLLLLGVAGLALATRARRPQG